MIRRIYLILIATILVIGANAADKRFTLVIDAGHGGHDAGAIGQLTKEKIINLNVALAFGQLVEQRCPDVRVVYTRKTDVFIPLKERANIANKAGADLFISVHTNALPAGRIARGFEVYTLGMHRAKDNLDVAMRENSVISMEQDYKQKYQGFNPRSSESYIMFEFMQSANMEKSVELAKYIQRSVCGSVGRNDMGVHQAGFLVLRETSMPSCLIELGFITTPDEERFLDSDDGVQSMARAIFKGFEQYKNRYSTKVVVPYAAPKDQSFQNMGHVLPQNINVDNNSKIKAKQTTSKKHKEKKKEEKAKPVTPSQQPTAKPAQTAKAETDSKPTTTGRGIVFKVQIFALNRSLRPGSQQFKGHKDVVSYRDGNVFKYTIGSTSNYNDIVKLRKSLSEDFPESFIIAFKDGQRIDINTAITESKKK